MNPATTSTSLDLLGGLSLLLALVAIRVLSWVWDRLSDRFEPIVQEGSTVPASPAPSRT